MSYALKDTKRSIEIERIDVLDSELDAVDEIEALTMDEAHIAAAEQSTARHLQYALDESIDAHASLLELTGDKLAMMYDPDLPTIAFDATHTFGGAELVGMSAARGMQKRLNVVYLNMATCGFTYRQQSDGSVVGMVKRAHIIDGQGNVLSGEIPKGLRVDAIESVDTELLTVLNSIGFLTLSNPENLKRYEDKHLLGRIGADAAIEIPTRFSIDDVTLDDDIVIKPSNASQGRGIYFGSQHNRTVEDWHRYYTYLEQKNYAPVVEERVECWPFFDPKTGEKLDWNVRAIISYGEVVDMYIRAGAEASAVNKSTGAKTIAMQDLAQYLGKDAPASARIVEGSLFDAARSLAESADDFIIGADLTINSRGEVVVFEVNAGHVGGLQTIAELKDGSKAKRLAAAQTILDGVARRMPPIDSPEDDSQAHRLPPTLNMKVDFLSQLNMFDLIGVSIDESTHSDVQPHTRLRILVAKLYESYSMLGQSEKQDSIIKAMMENPLEAAFYMPYISVLGSQALKFSVAELVEADAHSKEAKLSRIYAAAQDSDLSQVLEIFRSDTDKSILRHAGNAVRRITKDTTHGLRLDISAQHELDDVLSAYVAFISLANKPEMMTVASNELIQFCKNVPEKASRSVLSRIMIFMGQHELAAKQLSEVVIDDEDLIDYHMDTLNCYQDLIVRSEAGQTLIADYFMGIGGAQVLAAYKEQHGTISPEAERALAQYSHFFEAEQLPSAQLASEDVSAIFSMLEDAAQKKML